MTAACSRLAQTTAASWDEAQPALAQPLPRKSIRQSWPANTSSRLRQAPRITCCWATTGRFLLLVGIPTVAARDAVINLEVIALRPSMLQIWAEKLLLKS